MKKFLAVMLVLAFASCACGEVIGTLSRAGTDAQSPESTHENFSGSLLASVLAGDVDTKEIQTKFYDSLMLMQLALNRGEVNSIAAPEFVGEYLLRSNPAYRLRGFVIGRNPIAYAFGFLEGNAELCEKFSRAVQDMEEEGRIGILARDFITGPAAQNPPAVEFAKFDDAPTLKVALTGDMPPIDYVAPDGKPAGFNTAILAEIGRRLHVNINPVIFETGARAAALKSGRADVVFWFLVFMGYDAKQDDVPEGVITSTPYYGWNKSVLIGTK